MSNLPSKQDCYYIVEMLESLLINYRHTHPWADKIILNIDIPPNWLTELSLNKYQRNQITAIRKYAYCWPYDDIPDNLDKFHVGCLWLRYERRELSWATLLAEIGRYLDSANGTWDCETPYYYLNLHEENNYSIESEEKTKSAYLQEQNITPWAKIAKEKMQWFNCE